jgi:hypothetical protein
MYEVHVEYTESLVRRAVQAYFRRILRDRFGWSGIAAVVLTGGLLLYLLAIGDRSWVVGFMIAALLIIALLFCVAYFSQLSERTARINSFGGQPVTFSFRSEGFTVASPSVTVSLP